MSLVTIVAVIIVIGYAIFNQIAPAAQNPEVKSETNLEFSPTPDPTSSVSPNVSSRPKTSAQVKVAEGTSKITIDVDTGNGAVLGEKIIFPGAIGSDNKCETTTSGKEVCNWYKNELKNRLYSVKTSVCTQANEKFEGVIAGSAGEKYLKVVINQENSSAKTVITFE